MTREGAYLAFLAMRWSIWIPLLAALPITAQVTTGTTDPRVRTTALNDSVRQVDRLDKKGRTVLSTHYFQGDRAVGIWKEYDKKGALVDERDMDILRYGEPEDFPESVPAVSIDPTDTSLALVGVMPEFPGGEAELINYLTTNIRYPREAVDRDIQGLVHVYGVVDQTGDWRTVSIMRGVHPLLDHEAWRVSDGMPDWRPCIQQGKPVPVKVNLPILFRLR